MLNRLNNIYNILKSEKFKYQKGISFSQFSEDLIIHTICRTYNINYTNYLDIGANHPIYFNNTYFQYRQGYTGINIEPNIKNWKMLEYTRAKDINLNIAISSFESLSKFYHFENSMYDTMSEFEVEKLEKKGIRIVSSSKILTRTYNTLCKEYFGDSPPNMLFIDTEGYEKKIIDTIDFMKYAPKLMCIETYSYGSSFKNLDLINIIKSYGYTLIADTFVNSIFLRNDCF